MYPAHPLGDELFPVADASQLGPPPVPDMAFTDAELRALLNISHQMMHIHYVVPELHSMADTLLGTGVLRPGELIYFNLLSTVLRHRSRQERVS